MILINMVIGTSLDKLEYHNTTFINFYLNWSSTLLPKINWSPGRLYQFSAARTLYQLPISFSSTLPLAKLVLHEAEIKKLHTK